jgi:hypothetical protein
VNISDLWLAVGFNDRLNINGPWFAAGFNDRRLAAVNLSGQGLAAGLAAVSFNGPWLAAAEPRLTELRTNRSLDFSLALRFVSEFVSSAGGPFDLPRARLNHASFTHGVLGLLLARYANLKRLGHAGRTTILINDMGVTSNTSARKKRPFAGSRLRQSFLLYITNLSIVL